MLNCFEVKSWDTIDLVQASVPLNFETAGTIQASLTLTSNNSRNGGNACSSCRGHCSEANVKVSLIRVVLSGIVHADAVHRSIDPKLGWLLRYDSPQCRDQLGIHARLANRVEGLPSIMQERHISTESVVV